MSIVDSWAAPVLVGCAVAIITFLSSPASACPTCAVGDPTLTTMGVEQPLAGRVRAGLELREVEMRLHSGADRLRLVDRRLDTSISWAPFERWVFAADVPMVHRTLRTADGTTITAAGIGDVEIGARFHVWRDRPSFTRHHVAIRLAVDLPTATVARSSQDTALPHEVQPGTGSLDARVALTWGWLADPWSGWAQVTGTLESENDGFRNGPSVTIAGAVQAQPEPEVAVQLRADLRIDTPAEHHGAHEPDTGGAILFAGPQLLVAPIPELLLGVSIRLPVLNAMRGSHDEGPIALLTATAELY